MTRQSMFQAKKESQPLQSSSLFRRQAAQAPVEERETAALPVNLGRDFSGIPFRQPQPPMASISCPFSPKRCPFGGACHACPPKVQAKLKIGQPGDQYEQEADRVAEQVMRMPEPQVQRKGCSSCKGKEEDEDKILQAKPAGSVGNASAQVDHPLIQNVLSSPGQPLDAGTRSFMEPRFGQDFSGVRVHTGGQAAESARAVNARAYTVGRDVVFGKGQYAPGSDEGRRLMAHELVHVEQQMATFHVANKASQVKGILTVHQLAVPLLQRDIDPTYRTRLKRMSGQEINQELLDIEITLNETPLFSLEWSDLVEIRGMLLTELANRNFPIADPGTKGRTIRPVGTKGQNALILPALTPDELMERLVLTERGFQASPSGAPINTLKGKGSTLGPGYVTYAGIQIIDQEGYQVISVIGQYGGRGKAHAEVDAIRTLQAFTEKTNSVRGMRMMVVVDQIVCENCTNALEEFAKNNGIAQMDVYLSSRDKVTPKTASRTAAKVGAKARLSFTRKFTSEPTTNSYKTIPEFTKEASSRSGAEGGRYPSPTSKSTIKSSEGKSRELIGTKKVTAEEGMPANQVFEGTPGFRPQLRDAIGGAAQILYAMQFEGLQQAEIEKFQKRWNELQPRIDTYLKNGYSVELILIVEQPNSIDILCPASGYCDPSQFVYFNNLYINYIESVKPVIPLSSPVRPYPTIGPAGGRSGYIPYTHEGGSVIDEKEIPYLHARDSNHHCVYKKHTLHPISQH